MTGILDGTRVLEVEGLGPCPFAGMLLADFGADVIVVHRKGATLPPGMPEASLLDRGKRSIELDLRDHADVDIFCALVATVDGLIEGMRPGKMEGLGLGPEVCQGINPALVYGRMTGWGQDGPLSRSAGHDLNYLSMSGAAWYSGEPGGAPIPPPSLVGDIGGGAMYLVVGLLAGILAARQTGKGTVIDAAIYDGSAHMMNLLMALRQGGGLVEDRAQSLLDGPHWCRTYRTSDGGFMSVQCFEPKFYAIFLEKLGLSDDAAFDRQFDRAAWPELTDRLQDIFGRRDRQHWSALFLGSDACVAPVLSPDEALKHEMNAARGTWLEAEGVLQARPAPRFSGEGDWTPLRPVARGAHTEEILAGLRSGSD